MARGIKLSNQLYPATQEKILSQAEYIHDENWQGSNKDQQSINTYIKNNMQTLDQKIDDGMLTLDQKIDHRIEVDLKPGSGLFKNINLEDVIIGIDNTIYGFLDNIDNKYPGCIKGIVRGDVDEDGQVSISDVTAITDMLLEGGSNFHTITNILILEDPNIQIGNISSSKFKFNFKDISSSAFGQVSDENTVLENHIVLYDSSMRSTTSDKITTYVIELTQYYDSNTSQWEPLSNSNPITLTVKLTIGETPEQNIMYLYQEDNPDYINVDVPVNIQIEDPDRILRFPNQEDTINVSDISALIDFMFANEWDSEGYYTYFQDDSFYLSDNNNNQIPTCPGIVYQGIDKNNKIHYFISRDYDTLKENSSCKLYTIQFDKYNLDSNSLLEWLKSSIIVDSEDQYRSGYNGDINIHRLRPQYYIGYSFEKYTNNQLFYIFQQEHFHTDSDSSLQYFRDRFFNPTKKVIEVQNINDVVEIPIYFYDLDLCKYGETEYLNVECDPSEYIYSGDYSNQDIDNFHYTPEFYDGGIVANVNFQDLQCVQLVDKQGNPINELKINDIISKYPCITLRLKFNIDNIDDYEYVNEDGGYYKLKKDIILELMLEQNGALAYYIIPNNYGNFSNPELSDKLLNFKIRNL